MIHFKKVGPLINITYLFWGQTIGGNPVHPYHLLRYINYYGTRHFHLVLHTLVIHPREHLVYAHPVQYMPLPFLLHVR
jgi:hypothetical protein